jgi:hypothetical protein
MVKLLKRLVAVALLYGFASQAVAAQSDFVKLSFEGDSKVIRSKFKVFIYAEGKVIEPVGNEPGFFVPPEIKNCEKVGVKILFKLHKLDFEQVYLAKFLTDWIIGINNHPLVGPETARKIKFIYHINFVPADGDGTRVVVKVYNPQAQIFASCYSVFLTTHFSSSKIFERMNQP